MDTVSFACRVLVVEELCATNRKVAGSRPHEVNNLFNLPNLSGRTRF
jgi:hypothetical protein